jgi:hypothetical protein
MEIKVIDNIPVFMQAEEQAIEAALEAVGQMLDYECAMELGSDPRRIDTGNLALSMEHEVDGKTLTVGNNVEYGVYVHEGTSKMAANRFIRNGFMNNIDNIKNTLQAYLGSG